MRAWLPTFSVLLAAAPLLVGPNCTPEPVVHEVALGDFVLRARLAETIRTGRTEARFRYVAELVNGGGSNATGVTVVVTSNTGDTVVLDPVLVFGNVAAGATVESSDSYTIRQDRTVPYDPDLLDFEVVQDSIPDVPDWIGTMGSSGGVLDARQGRVVLEFPPGAVPDGTEIRVTPVPNNIGRAQVLPATAHDFGPDGIVFAQPVQITLAYDEADLPDGLPEDDSGLFLVATSHTDDEFVVVPGSKVDPLRNTVSAPLSGFSTVLMAINCEIRVPGSSISRYCPEFELAPDDPGGDLDPSFGANGKLVLDLGSNFSSLRDLVIDPQQRLLLAGENPHLAVVRVLPDGEGLDPTFGTNGIANASPQADSVASAIALQSDGRILVAGSSNEPPPLTSLDLVVARFTAGGQLDPTFGVDGVVVDQKQNNLATDVIPLPDGRILVTSTNGIYQYESDGTPDASFGVDGLAVDLGNRITAIRKATGYWLVPRGFSTGVTLDTLMPDGSPLLVCGVRGCEGKSSPSGFLPGGMGPWGLFEVPGDGYIVGGTTGGSGVAHPAVARFNADLTPKLEFGFGDGVQSADFGGNEQVLDMAVQADGRIVLLGVTDGPNDRDFFVVRFRPDGGVDAGFGNGGIVILDFGGVDNAGGVAIDAEGRIVVAGETASGGVRRGAVARILP